MTGGEDAPTHDIDSGPACPEKRDIALVAPRDIRMALDAGFSRTEIAYMLDLSEAEADRLARMPSR